MMKNRSKGKLGGVARWMGGALLAAAFINGNGAPPAHATPLQLPPIVRPATGEHHPGKVIFLQLVTPDLAAAKKFYGALFGWSFREFDSGGISYAEATVNGRPVAGIVRKEIPAGRQRTPAWLTFISVRDLDAARKVAVANGAKVLLEPRQIPRRGKEAVFLDPEGAVFAALSSSAGDPPDVLTGQGEWVWSALSAPDPDRAADFYQKLFDYEVFELPNDAAGNQHLLVAGEHYARASINQSPKESEGRAHWLNFVRVRDAAAMAARAEQLGGRVLVSPRPDRHGGKLAVVADPQGAVFGVMEWTAEGEEVVQ